jgi:hypothetical protein
MASKRKKAVSTRPLAKRSKGQQPNGSVNDELASFKASQALNVRTQTVPVPLDNVLKCVHNGVDFGEDVNHPPSIEFDRDFGAKAVIATRGVYVVSGLWSADRNWRPIGYSV